jgi:hypothetical protein
MREPHPIPVCAALELLGLSGAEVARSLSLHPNIWSKWKAGQAPHARTRAALLVLARNVLSEGRAMLARREFSTCTVHTLESTLTEAAELLNRQESEWGSLSVAGLLQAERKLSSPPSHP